MSKYFEEIARINAITNDADGVYKDDENDELIIKNDGFIIGGIPRDTYDNWMNKIQDKNIIFGCDTGNTDSKDSDIYCNHIKKQLNNSLIIAYMQTFKCSKRVAKIKLKRNNLI